MPTQRINDIELYYELTGGGDETVVLVHGSWTDHLSWQLVAPALAERFRVLNYDRRGHSRSVDSTRHGSRRQHEEDLAALIESLNLGGVHLVGNSYGGSISLGLASHRPDLVRCVIAHEPPLLGVTAMQPGLDAELMDVHRTVETVSELLRSGDPTAGARHFVEQVLGPGTWQMLPDDSRRAFVANAATFLAMLADPLWSSVPTVDDVPVLLTDGDASPGWLPGIVSALQRTMYRRASRHTFSNAGHVPHLTDAQTYVASVQSFISTGAALQHRGLG